MGRLIDADKLKADLEKAISKNEDMDCLDFLRVASVIDAQPTAYDQDKVVDQLESELRLADKEKERCARENPLQFDSAKGYAMGLSNAIEIVKAGGKDAEN